MPQFYERRVQMPSRERCGEQSEEYLRMIPATDMLSISCASSPALALIEKK